MNNRHTKSKELTMKTLNRLVVTAAAVVIVSAAVSAQTNEPLLSPRAKSNQIRTVPAGTSANDPDLIREFQNRPGTPRSKELADSVRKVPRTGRDINLAHAPRPMLSPKDPRYEMVLRENAIRQLQIAPLK